MEIEIDLTRQRALLYFEGRVMYESPISSGRAGHRTPTGDFAVVERTSTTSPRSTDGSSMRMDAW